MIVIEIFFVVAFGLGTFAVFGGVIFTVSLHVPAFRPLTLVPETTEQMVFVVDVAAIVDLATTVTPNVFNADDTVTIFFTVMVTVLAAVVPPVVG